MSAIPWVGQDIVEFIWGGLKTVGPHYGDVVLKILLNAGKSPNLVFAYDLFFLLITIIYVKIAMTRGQSAGVRNIHTSEASQRLHAGDLSKKIKHLNSFYSFKSKLGPQAKLNLFTRGYSNSASLPPSYITGFSDGESSFHISVLKKKGYKMLYQVLPVFTIQLHIKDLYLLEKIQSFFGVGVITKKSKSNSVIYSVQSLKDLNLAIIPHFDKYPLLTQKQADFTLFKQVINLIKENILQKMV